MTNRGSRWGVLALVALVACATHRPPPVTTAPLQASTVVPIVQGTITLAPCMLEGPNKPDGPFLGIASDNCQPRLESQCGCATDADCGPAGLCSVSSHLCVMGPRALCTLDGQCAPGRTCRPPEFTRAMSFLVAPSTAGGEGFIAVPCCQYHTGDACPALPPGRYEVAGSQVDDPTIAAVVTRAQISLTPYQGYGDGGSDQPGEVMACTTTTTTLPPTARAEGTEPLLENPLAAYVRKPRRPSRRFGGVCVVDDHGKAQCRFTGDVPADLKATRAR